MSIETPGLSEVRDLWVDRTLDHLPRAEAIRLVPEAQAAFEAAIDEVRSAVRLEVRNGMQQLIADLIDPGDCWFDHHGGCQEHGYLSLEPDEQCPHAEAKAWLREALEVTE